KNSEELDECFKTLYDVANDVDYIDAIARIYNEEQLPSNIFPDIKCTTTMY
ncbi:8165_t:CDS:2, partial [Entrophospora sp. SA101]